MAEQRIERNFIQISVEARPIVKWNTMLNAACLKSSCLPPVQPSPRGERVELYEILAVFFFQFLVGESILKGIIVIVLAQGNCFEYCITVIAAILKPNCNHPSSPFLNLPFTCTLYQNKYTTQCCRPERSALERRGYMSTTNETCSNEYIATN